MERTDDCTLKISEIVDVTVEKMWIAWSEPEHIANWWGPEGFTSTIRKMEMKEGGEWLLTLHGPDGKNYPNRSIFKEVLPFHKIKFEHFNPHFFTTVIFESKGKGTNLTWNMQFDSPEMYDTIVKAHKADEGLKQSMKRLTEYLSKIQSTI
jgi:uncharacterized protein YndB with AHSA1/START domain